MSIFCLFLHFLGQTNQIILQENSIFPVFTLICFESDKFKPPTLKNHLLMHLLLDYLQCQRTDSKDPLSTFLHVGVSLHSNDGNRQLSCFFHTTASFRRFRTSLRERYMWVHCIQAADKSKNDTYRSLFDRSK